jgi:hypothetical protein
MCVASTILSREEASSGLHGCDVLYELVRPWANSDRLVVADSYFASVTTAIYLKKNAGLRFIGVVKTATKGYPMQYLSNVPLLGGKGDQKGLLSTDTESGTTLLAFVWVDRDRRYFIATAGSLAKGRPIQRVKWTQVDRDTPNAEPARVGISIDQPEAAELYYAASGKIDQHNRHRQASLMLETKLKTMNWHMRLNLTVFGMCVVDSFLLMQGTQGDWLEQRSYYEMLAEQLIDNTFDSVGLRPRKRVLDDGTVVTHGSSKTLHPFEADCPRKSLHLTAPTPTKKRKKTNKKHRAQGKCMMCSKHTSFVCRECQRQQDPNGAYRNQQSVKQHWICRDKAGLLHCMGKHIAEKHQHLIANDESHLFLID